MRGYGIDPRNKLERKVSNARTTMVPSGQLPTSTTGSWGHRKLRVYTWHQYPCGTVKTIDVKDGDILTVGKADELEVELIKDGVKTPIFATEADESI